MGNGMFWGKSDLLDAAGPWKGQSCDIWDQWAQRRHGTGMSGPSLEKPNEGNNARRQTHEPWSINLVSYL